MMWLTVSIISSLPICEGSIYLRWVIASTSTPSWWTGVNNAGNWKYKLTTQTEDLWQPRKGNRKQDDKHEKNTSEYIDT